MIDEVDAALRALLKEEALDGSDVDVVFDAPTKEWAARRNAPMVNAYLYDIREDLRKRTRGMVNEYDATGTVVGRRLPPRFYNLSYLVTAWTQRPEDEHRLLARMLMCFTSYEAMPPDRLAGALGRLGLPVEMRVSLPPPEDRSFADVWTALGGELKPSIDVVLSVPLAPARLFTAGPPVKEGPVVRVRDVGARAGQRGPARPPAAGGGGSDSAGEPQGGAPGAEGGSTGERGGDGGAPPADETVRGRRAPSPGTGAGGAATRGGGDAGGPGRRSGEIFTTPAAAWLRLAGRTGPPAGAGSEGAGAAGAGAEGAQGAGPAAPGPAGTGRSAGGGRASRGRGGRRGLKVSLEAADQPQEPPRPAADRPAGGQEDAPPPPGDAAGESGADGGVG